MLSIVTVSFNNLAGLQRTFKSIECQRESNFEWIVIDGGSSDGSIEFLRSLHYPVKFISERDSGIYDAMRKGLWLAERDYILFLNSGDRLSCPSSLNTLLDHLDGSDVFFFSCKVTGLGRIRIRHPRALASAVYSVPAIQQATVYRVSCLKTLVWPETFKICGDYSIAVQLYRKSASASSFPIVVSEFDLGGVSTIKPFSLAIEAFNIQRIFLNLPYRVRVFYFFRRVCTGISVFLLFKFKSFS